MKLYRGLDPSSDRLEKCRRRYCYSTYSDSRCSRAHCEICQLLTVVTLVSSSINTPTSAAFLPINNTFIASYTVEEIILAIVDFLLASIVDSLVDLGLIIP